MISYPRQDAKLENGKDGALDTHVTDSSAFLHSELAMLSPHIEDRDGGKSLDATVGQSSLLNTC